MAFDAAGLALAAAAVFLPVLGNGFVNWDDPTVLVDNAQLAAPGVGRWAFTTSLIGHFQPLSWIAWSATKSWFGLSPSAFHGLSLTIHIANGVLVYALARRLLSRTSLTPSRRRIAAVLAAALFLVHPSTVETVAWASAFPYVLSLFWLLLSLLAYVNRYVAASFVAYAVSLLARVSAPGFPIVLLVLDFHPLARDRNTSWRRLIFEKTPFFVLATAAGALEWRSRDTATLQEVDAVTRVTMAAAAPFVYAWRTIWPVRLSPLNPLPISPRVELLPLALGVTALMVVTTIAWRVRHRHPGAAAAWAIYLALLAPIAGLIPSGIQATADRYMYLPIVPVAIGFATLVAGTAQASGAAVALLAAAILAFAVVTRQQVGYWKDSIALWSRAAELDPRNDVATYNLAIAMRDAGRESDAIAWYERTLVLVPDHDLARRGLAILRSKRGMSMMRQGQLRDAIPELRLAFESGAKDAEVANALAFALARTGSPADAADVLTRAVADHPDNINVKHNLARLLATSEDARVRDGPRALRLALDVCERTANRDPRALDTLAAAYAAVGSLDLARRAAQRGEARARELGDLETADEIAAHAHGYRR
jgi:protein O-mannosyl-transferase